MRRNGHDTDSRSDNRRAAEVVTAQAVLLELIDKARTSCHKSYNEGRTKYEEFQLRMLDLEAAERLVDDHLKPKDGIF